MSNDNLLNEFLLESQEALGAISGELTRLEKETENIELINDIYRKVHTLKGSSSFLGYKKLQEVAHSAENLLDLLREKKAKVQSELIDILLKSTDICSSIIKNIENSGIEGDVSTDEIKATILAYTEKLTQSNVHDLQQAESKLDTGSDELEQLISEHKEHAESINDVEEIQEVQEVKEVEAILPEVEEVSAIPTAIKEETPSASVQKEENADSHKGNLSDGVVRVNVNLLDKILNVVGELVLNRNQILQYSNGHNDVVFAKLSQQLNVITTELQNDIMMTRMQPIGSILGKYDRLIRDFSREHNKKIKMKITGQDTELDKTLIETIKDPLTHILRNAADHGIESIEERIKSNKNEEATIGIKAYHESGQVTIEISDDGKGINKERVKKKAIEKNIYTEAEVNQMTDAQIYNIIFMPGFSTAEKVTNISGRGVGMDVVKTNIEKIGGSVLIETQEGKGTTFKLKIPLTLAIIPALIVSSSNEFFAIPQINLVELVRVGNKNKDGQNGIEKIYDAELFRLRGKLIPIIRLGKILGLKEKEKKENEEESIVILNAEGIVYGVIVDQILDTEEIVVKPLWKNLKNLSMFAGATIMGDGSVSIIIDAVGLISFVKKDNGSNFKKGEEKIVEAEAKHIHKDSQENILFRLGDQRIYGIPLCLVGRLEEFPVQKIEYTGDLAIVRYQDKPMPLINMEKTLKLSGKSALEKYSENGLQKISAIVVQLRNLYYGIVVDEIVDIDITTSEMSGDTIDREGIIGTIFIGDKVASIIDVYNIIERQTFSQEELPLSKNIQVNNDFRPSKILVVDDSPFYRKTVEQTLASMGNQVVTAGDGEEALQILKKEKDFKLIVTDIEMPKMNGYELAQKVNAQEDLKVIPIMALSTRCSTEDKEKGKIAGFSAHLEKLKKDEVIEKVKFFLKTGTDS